MSEPAQWVDLGATDELKADFADRPVRQITVGRTPVALSYREGRFGAISGLCNHVGGPLGDGHLDGDYVVCPWHHWKFHRGSGEGEPGSEEDRVPSYELKEEAGRLLLRLPAASARHRLPHAPHPLARKPERAAGPLRLAGISTTAMDRDYPRFSTSDELLRTALDHAASALGVETRLLRLNELNFRACEGYYSKSARACTWPCSITQMDPKDEMDQVYEAFVHWADVLLVATPIRWGAASSLYYKMVERLNCIQNQIPLANRVLLKNKVAAFVITGGQDNVQAVAGQMLGFFAEVGCVFPPYPYIAHSRGWSAEDMERNVEVVRESQELHEGARELVARSVAMAKILLDSGAVTSKLERGGRKAFRPKRETTAAQEGEGETAAER